jgi:transposase InsO family protein
MNLDLVLKTIDNLEKYYLKNSISLKNTLLHSDQGFQYTNLSYHKKLKDLGIIQSMSRKGNSIDNAIIETFFGHLKDEIITKDLDFNQLKKEIDKYMVEYNYQRKQ